MWVYDFNSQFHTGYDTKIVETLHVTSLQFDCLIMVILMNDYFLVAGSIEEWATVFTYLGLTVFVIGAIFIAGKK
ncbi:hypothetical protein DSM106972_023400 [Dulcicalothrix desertica PCC 7102]|uniref:Uncharacterized protein n=1 Tax=Dulcicalothrix desertica PCC 7102 TaxID=232991 RepID=A0A433VLV7_9CYAN|nr:hypothetical protein DSM106972_023400 [Dulcicalothrix desertica PCC 7102]